ncbi:MAG: formylglycine-generating enzyme family protein [Deltaproteobacteria bacterium]|jgi:formylglycine-generating enzyme required for sulfatase activity|nr:formylglycine-generating enzyme family protein [Deltaproteobacteria bacterium]
MAEKQCPVCFTTVDDSKNRCPYCGWDFPTVPNELADNSRWLMDRIVEARHLFLSRRNAKPSYFSGPKLNFKMVGDAPSFTLSPSPEGNGGAKIRPSSVRWSPARLKLVKDPPEYVNKFKMAFLFLKAGDFYMGAGEQHQAQLSERPKHKVRLNRPFYLGKFPVTQGQWDRIMGYNPSRCLGPLRPVENVSWHDAMEFIEKLNKLENCNHYALPTEAQWEYAAQAMGRGWQAQYEPGFILGANIGLYAWHINNSKGKTQPVGLKRGNRWSLYDMLGNVWEWVADWHGPYKAERQVEPKGPAEGREKVIKGGCWDSEASVCCPWRRNCHNPDSRSPLIGFRLAIGPEWNSGEER